MRTNLRRVKSIVDDRGKTKTTLKGKDSQSFKIWIFYNGQTDRHNDCNFCSNDFNLGATYEL